MATYTPYIDKTEKAIRLIKLLQEEKLLVKIKNFTNFLELVDKIKEQL